MERWRGRVLQAGEYELAPLFPENVGETYLAWLHDRDVTRFLEVARKPPPSVADLAAWVGGFDGESRIIFGIYVAPEKRHIGNVTLYEINKFSGVAHYGLMVGDRSYWGKAVATSAMRAIFDFAFDELKLRRITAGASARNLPTIINFKKMGLKQEGVFRRHLREDDEYVDEVRYALMRDDWRAFKASGDPPT